MSLLQRDEDDKEYYNEIKIQLEKNGINNFDEKDLTYNLEKRMMSLDSISKLYNDLSMVNKVKMKDFENDMSILKVTKLNFKVNEKQKKPKKK